MRSSTRPLAAWIAVLALAAAVPCLCAAPPAVAAAAPAASCHSTAPAPRVAPAQDCDCCAGHLAAGPAVASRDGRAVELAPVLAVSALADPPLAIAPTATSDAPSPPPDPPPRSIQVLRI